MTTPSAFESNLNQRTVDYSEEFNNGYHIMLDTGVLVTVRWNRSVLLFNGGNGHTGEGLVPQTTYLVALTGQVFCEHHVARVEHSNCPITDRYLHLTSQHDEIMTSEFIMPI